MRLNNRKCGFSITTLVFLIFAYSGVHAGSSISPSVLADRIDTSQAPLILDVRTVGEFKNGHIPGAVNIPHRQLASRLSELIAYKDQEIVVHCQRGPRADFALSVLTDAGFMRLRELEGHMYQWNAGGFPIE